MVNLPVPNKISVRNFYKNKSVFITGATGFIGKLLLEKLLYSCDGLERIYILVRRKNGEDPEKRLNAIFDNVIFTRIKQEKPHALLKVVPVEGDLSHEDLALSESQCEDVINKVSVVFHVAATVKFNEPFKTSLTINVGGTKAVINLCKRIKKLEALVHVSTAYSNTDKKVVQEIVYPLPSNVDEVYSFIKEHGNARNDSLLNGRPNTYTYSKAIAEVEMQKNMESLPIVIVRPSIVTATLREPFSGWLDNWNGPTLILLAIAKGTHRFMHGKSKNIADFIPADIVSNMIVVAATTCQRSKLTVYNCCSGPRNPVTYRDATTYAINAAVNNKLNVLPLPYISFVNSESITSLLNFLFCSTVAYIADLVRLILRKKAKYVKILREVQKTAVILSYFVRNQWIFHDKNVRTLISSMSDYEKQQFFCDPSTFDWKEYMKEYMLGIHKYLLKI